MSIFFLFVGQSYNQEKFMNSCWVRNYIKAPEDLDVKSMRNGKSLVLEE